MILGTVGRQTVPQPYSGWEESKLVGIHTAVRHKISGYALLFEMHRHAEELGMPVFQQDD